MTYRQLINEVLIRLREETIPTDWSGNINDSTAVNDYQKVIGSLINDAKRSIESYHDWLALRETKSINTIAGTKSYSLSSGQEIKLLDVVNKATGTHLIQVSRTYLNDVSFPTDPTGDPQYYGFNGLDSSNNLKVDLSPVPDKVQALSFDMVKYQDTLTTAPSVLKIPTNPVILGAWARAISERGEDGGNQSSIVAAEASNAVAQSIMVDSGNTQYETDWFLGNMY